MNWEAAAVVVEIVAATGVIVALLHLAAQLKQGSVASVASVKQDISESFQSANALVAGSSDLAGISLRGSLSLDSLSPEESIRFGSLMMSFFNTMEQWHSQLVTARLLTPETSAEMARVLRSRLIFEGISEWYEANLDDFAEDFRRWVSEVRGAD